MENALDLNVGEGDQRHMVQIGKDSRRGFIVAPLERDVWVDLEIRLEDGTRLICAEFAIDGTLYLPIRKCGKPVGVGEHIRDGASDCVDVFEPMLVGPSGLIGGKDEAPARLKVPEELTNIGIGD